MGIETFRHSEGLSSRQRELSALLDLSEQILSFAELGDWGSAVKLQRHRRLSMDAFFAEPCAPSESAEVARVIRDILSIDHQVSDILYNFRHRLAKESGAESRGMRQVDTYLSNSL